MPLKTFLISDHLFENHSPIAPKTFFIPLMAAVNFSLNQVPTFENTVFIPNQILLKNSFTLEKTFFMALKAFVNIFLNQATTPENTFLMSCQTLLKNSFTLLQTPFITSQAPEKRSTIYSQTDEKRPFTKSHNALNGSINTAVKMLFRLSQASPH